MANGPATQLTVREARPDDLKAALALRNEVFPPIGAVHWRHSQTAAIARLDDRLVGVIPFIIRPFVLAPGVVIRAAFANSVAVAEGMRGLGIGSRMMDAARQFLPAHAEAMCVYTLDEANGPQYRFYRRAGHHDLLYPRRLTKAVPEAGAVPSGSALASIDEVARLETELLDVYAACYACWGGFPRRELGYWPRALNSHIFVEEPYDAFDLMLSRNDGQLAAYAIAGTRECETTILECAARDAIAAESLWAAVDALAAARAARSVAIHGQDYGSPRYDSLRRAGFVAQPRNGVLSGQVVAPEALFAQSLRAADGARDLAFEVWTPERSLRLGAGEVRLRLEMKEDELHRLLLHRLDLESAIRQQRVTVREGDDACVRDLASVLSYVPWVYHHLDYI